MEAAMLNKWRYGDRVATPPKSRLGPERSGPAHSKKSGAQAL